jgi:hypothetical protein
MFNLKFFLIFFIKMIFIVCCCFGQNKLYVQQPSSLVSKEFKTRLTTKYLKIKVKKVKKLAKVKERVLKHSLLKVAKFEKKIVGIDSLQVEHLNGIISTDSLMDMMSQDNFGAKGFRSSFQNSLDSVSKIISFNRNKVESIGKNEYSDLKLIGLQNELDLITQHFSKNEEIVNLLNKRISNIAALPSLENNKHVNKIQQEQYYMKQKMQNYKSLIMNPDAIEQKAFAYLRGLPGFEESLGKQTILDQKDLSALEKDGFQTKQLVKKQFTSQIAPNANADLQYIGINAQKQFKDLQQKKQRILEAKGKAKKLNYRMKPTLKVNPMKGLPLKMRLEKSFNYQVLPTSINKPAMLQLNAQLGFKQTKNLTYGVVFGTNLGLGRNWQNIKFANEGLRVGINSTYKGKYGLSGIIGMERNYKRYTLPVLIPAVDFVPQQYQTITKNYTDITFAGIQKKYHINSKYHGTLLLAYNFNWKAGNENSPLIWRMGWGK